MKKLLTVFLFLSATAGVSRAATYYVDCVSGLDSNSGTAKTTPWKHSPGMAAFTGTYTHAAGDQIIFKGGVTCPQSFFPLNITNSGATGNHDYYGVDVTWFSGASFTRPLFDMAFTPLASPYIVVNISGAHITIDNIEIAHQGLPAGESGAGGVTDQTSASDILVENMYIHDWRPTSVASAYGGSDPGGGGISFQDTPGDEIADSNTIGPAQDGSGGTTLCFGTGISQGFQATNNTITNACDMIHGAQTIVAGNTFGFGKSPYVTVNHNNVFFQVSSTGQSTYIYNNLEIGPFAGEYEGLFTHPCWNGHSNATLYFFNNVVQAAAHYIEIDNGGGAGCNSTGSNSTVWIMNNTCFSGGTCGRITDAVGTPITNLHLLNNHWMCNSFVTKCYEYNNEGGAGSGSATNIVDNSPPNIWKQSESAGNAQGYTASNNFAPINASGITVGEATAASGGNLTSMCTGLLVPLCSDRLGVARPATGNWDAGAYEFVSGPVVSFSPTSIAFGSQAVGTTSAVQTIQLSNIGTSSLTINASGGITLAGVNPADFAITGGTCANGGTVTAGSNCTIIVDFTPASVASFSASVSVADNEAGSPQTVALTGTGVSAVNPAPTATMFSTTWKAVPLPAAPVPTLSSTAPQSSYVTAGGFSQDGVTMAQTLVVKFVGSNFVSGSTATFDGKAATATFISPSEVDVTVPLSMVSLPASATSHTIVLSVPVAAVPPVN